MPITSSVISLNLAGPGTAGAFLRALDGGLAEPADLVAVPVAAGGEVDADEALEARLPVPAADIIAAARMSGKAGQIAQAVIRAGDAKVRVVYLGVGDRSNAELRRAGGELGRLLQPAERSVASVVAGQPDGQVRAFAEGILLGSYRFSEKSANADADLVAGQAEVRLAGTG